MNRKESARQPIDIFDALRVFRERINENYQLYREKKKEIKVLKEEGTFSTANPEAIRLTEELKAIVKENETIIAMQKKMRLYLENASEQGQTLPTTSSSLAISELNKTIEQKREEIEKQAAKEKESAPDMEEVFVATIYDQVEFNKKHPYYYNKDFKEMLLAQYIYEEKYEKCAQLVKMK